MAAGSRRGALAKGHAVRSAGPPRPRWVGGGGGMLSGLQQLQDLHEGVGGGAGRRVGEATCCHQVRRLLRALLRNPTDRHKGSSKLLQGCCSSAWSHSGPRSGQSHLHICCFLQVVLGGRGLGVDISTSLTDHLRDLTHSPAKGAHTYEMCIVGIISAWQAFARKQTAVSSCDLCVLQDNWEGRGRTWLILCL